MSQQKPGLPKGMRDFGPDKMAKRNYIFNTIKSTFEKFGFQPLETPSMENLSVLTGKYGEEGDQLIFKVLNSGDFLTKTNHDDLQSDYRKLLPKIAEKGLKYDLTVPFARFVVMNQHDLVFPFRRYQIQPVWRADRPQKGRYREFYQCDADVIGTDSLTCEGEIISMINEVFDLLKISDYSIKINNRKILKGIADSIGAEDQLNELCVAIDKLDKIGEEKVLEELRSRSISDNSINEFKAFLKIKGGFESKLIETQRLISESEAGLQGISEMKQIIGFLQDMELENHHLVFDPLLARGLSYYTGTILEVKVNNVNIGSVSGGGRYDDLTGIFGMPSVSGVGISFGVDRIYDVLETLDLFPPESSITSTVLIIPFVEKSLPHGLKALSQLRAAGVKSEIYPDLAKLKKQMSYADKKNIPFVVLLGEEEITNDFFTLKDMVSGEQSKYNLSDLIEFLSSK